MSKSFVSTDPNTHQGDNTWFTPKNITEPLMPFDLDPCTVSYRPYDIARYNLEHDLGDCGLFTDWDNRFVWLNPPYGKEIEPFIEKFIKHNNGIALVFARMGTNFMQNILKNRKEDTNIFFLRKRIKFINRYGVATTNAGTDSCLICCGKLAIDRVKNSNLEGVFLL